MSELWLPKQVSVNCDDYRDDTSLDDDLALAVVHKIAYDGKMQAIHYSVATGHENCHEALMKRVGHAGRYFPLPKEATEPQATVCGVRDDPILGVIYGTKGASQYDAELSPVQTRGMLKLGAYIVAGVLSFTREHIHELGGQPFTLTSDQIGEWRQRFLPYVTEQPRSR